MGAYAYERIAVEGTAIGFTASVIALPKLWGRECKSVKATVETSQLRYTVDGTVPTDAIGHQLAAGDTIDIDGSDIAKFLSIKVTASSTLRCTFSD